MASFPLTALSGMYMSALFCARNLACNSTLYYLLIDELGYKKSCLIGFFI
jgi:hypothetical protein